MYSNWILVNSHDSSSHTSNIFWKNSDKIKWVPKLNRLYKRNRPSMWCLTTYIGPFVTVPDLIRGFMFLLAASSVPCFISLYTATLRPVITGEQNGLKITEGCEFTRCATGPSSSSSYLPCLALGKTGQGLGKTGGSLALPYSFENNLITDSGWWTLIQYLKAEAPTTVTLYFMTELFYNQLELPYFTTWTSVSQDLQFRLHTAFLWPERHRPSSCRQTQPL